MVDLAINGRGGRVALDLYSGVGLFTLPLARRFERVVAVESSPVSADDLRSVAPANVKVSSQTTEKYLTCALGKLRPDLIVVDPPRSGLGPVVSREISKLSASEVVYVSCDPATLARDLKQLTSSAFEIAQIHLIDLFPHTFHVETCAILRR
jgi:23S rRNA (uracil1939-C5)-methyltransferase